MELPFIWIVIIVTFVFFLTVINTWGLAIAHPVIIDGSKCGKQMYNFMEVVGWVTWIPLIFTCMVNFGEEPDDEELFKLNEFKILRIIFIGLPMLCYESWFIYEFYSNKSVYIECNENDARIAILIAISNVTLNSIYYVVLLIINGFSCFQCVDNCCDGLTERIVDSRQGFSERCSNCIENCDNTLVNCCGNCNKICGYESQPSTSVNEVVITQEMNRNEVNEVPMAEVVKDVNIV